MSFRSAVGVTLGGKTGAHRITVIAAAIRIANRRERVTQQAAFAFAFTSVILRACQFAFRFTRRTAQIATWANRVARRGNRRIASHIANGVVGTCGWIASCRTPGIAWITAASRIAKWCCRKCAAVGIADRSERVTRQAAFTFACANVVLRAHRVAYCVTACATCIATRADRVAGRRNGRVA